jgi:hypothetical protein
MSDTLRNDSNREGFEVQDLSPQGVFYFMAGLAIVGLLIYFIILGMYRFLDAYDRKHQQPMNPMATSGVNPKAGDFHGTQEQVEKTFPKPLLEYSERTQFTEELEKEDLALEGYDWVDQKSGIVHIPIEQAMDLIAQRGLPVLPASEAARGGQAVKQGTGAKAHQATAPPGK